MIRSGGLDEPAAVYMAARDMRLEYHLSFIHTVDKTAETIQKILRPTCNDSSPVT